MGAEDGAKGAATTGRRQGTERISSMLYQDRVFHIHSGVLSTRKEEQTLLSTFLRPLVIS